MLYFQVHICVFALHDSFKNLIALETDLFPGSRSSVG